MENKLTIFGNHDDNTINQIKKCLEDDRAVAGVLCADGHYGYAHPIGGVVAYKDAISISGVGFDIGCGNLALKTDANVDSVRSNIKTIMNDIQKNIAFGIGKIDGKFKDHKIFASSLWNGEVAKGLIDKARMQLGTVGSGNHYIDIFVGDDGFIWVGVHFGSRGLGHSIASHFMKALDAVDRMDADPCVVDANSYIGNMYIRHMKLAGMYAEAGRDCVANFVAKNILGANVISEVSNHHNFAWEEIINGEKCWACRKGSTPNMPGQFSFIGGSMGDDAVIAVGTGHKENSRSLFSTVHGAGRVIGRINAKKTLSVEDMNNWLRREGVYRVGGEIDESPEAYRRLPDVLKFHENSTKIVTRLKPIGVAMAGSDDYDPYKD